MGAGACRVEGAARRACDPRQSRLVGDDKTVQRDGQGPTITRQALEAVGIPVYENDVVRLTKAGRPFWVAGLGDQLAYLPARRFRPVRRIGVDDLTATLAKVTDDAPVILLAHEPDVAMRVRRG